MPDRFRSEIRRSRSSRIEVRDTNAALPVKEVNMRTASLSLWLMLFPVFWCGSLCAQPVEGTPWRMSAELSGFNLVVPEDASPMLREAGRVFERLWKQATRRTISVSALNEGFTNIWLGTENIPADLLSPQEANKLQPDEFLVRTFVPRKRESLQGARKQMFIAGGTERATLHGVYTFFIREMGVSWLEPGLIYAPRAVSEIYDIDFSGRPEFRLRQIGLLCCWPKNADEYRNAYWLSPGTVMEPGDPGYYDHYADTGLSAGSDTPHVLYGSKAGAERLFEEIKTARDVMTSGHRDINNTQRQGSFAWQTEEDAIWLLAAMAHVTPVLSEEGRSLNEREGSPAAAILDTANGVAEMLQDAFPGESHLVHVLLSPKIQQAPRELRAHPNVIVQLSTGDCNFATPLNDRTCPSNMQFVDQIKEWKRLGPRLHIYDYLVNANDPRLPFPSLNCLQPNILFYLQNGVRGLYFAGVPGGCAGGVDLAALRVFLAARFLSNPDASIDEGKRIFFEGYYGPAAKVVEQYDTLLENDLKQAGGVLKITDECSWLSNTALSEIVASFQAVLNQDLPGDIRKRVEEVMASAIRVQTLRDTVQAENSETGGG